MDRDDGVIDEEYWGGFGPGRISLIASSSKMITAGVLLRLPTTDSSTSMRPSPTSPPGERPTRRSRRPSCCPTARASSACFPTPRRAVRLSVPSRRDHAGLRRASIFATPDDDGDIAAPDTEFRYGGAQWQVAGAVAEVASGKSWAQLIDEIYVQPCGLETLAYNNHFTQLGTPGFEYPDGVQC